MTRRSPQFAVPENSPWLPGNDRRPRETLPELHRTLPHLRAFRANSVDDAEEAPIAVREHSVDDDDEAPIAVRGYALAQMPGTLREHTTRPRADTMYSACLYCSHALGTNEVVEAFPVGRRLAFDGAKGRLWVVCPSCQRWCLAPIEERWEAIESCEREFRAARVRASTPEIGLVRLREGLELVRVGAPIRPELAAWRYGRQFSARRRKAIAVGIGTAGLAAAGGAVAVTTGFASAWVGLLTMGVTPVLHVTALAGFAAYSALDSLRAIPVQLDDKTVRVYRADLRETHLVTSDTGDGWGLRLKHAYGRTVLTGDEAIRAASRLLARANGSGAAGFTVDGSVRRLVEAPSLDEFIRTTARHADGLATDFAQRKQEWMRAFERNAFTAGKFDETANPAGLTRMEAPVRLALEMALHEESERVALEGELAPLLAAWREAEVIAGIADSLLTPPSVEARLDELQRGRAADTQAQ